MKLYLAAGQYVGTQAEAKARAIDKLFEQVDVPTDKDGLIAYLNQLHNAMRDAHDQFETVVERQDPPVERVPAAIMSLEDLFAEAPLTQQVDLVVSAMDRVNAALRSPMFAPAANPVMPEVAAMADAEDDELFS